MTLKSRIILVLGLLALVAMSVQMAGAAKTVFSDGNPSLGIKGTRVTAAFLNSVNKHFCTGLDTDGDCELAYSAATGTNDLVSTITPTTSFPASYVTGMPIYTKATVTNTGAMTLNVNGIGAKAIKRAGNVDLIAGDIAAGQVFEVAYDGTVFQLLSSRSSQGLASGGATLDSNGRLAQDANTLWDGTAGRSVAATPAANGIVEYDASGHLPWAGKAAFRGALAYLTSNVTTTSGQSVTISFDSEAYDTDSIHSTSSNQSRLTVPAGVSYVKLSAQIYHTVASTSDHLILSIYKNGAVFYPAVETTTANLNGASSYQISTPVISVSPGDYFTVFALQSSGSNGTISGSANSFTWFSMEIIQ